MDVREKLVELIRNAHKKCKAKKTCHECKQYGNGSDCVYLFMADELIAHGVTVQEWISVKDRLPQMPGKYLVCGGCSGDRAPQIWMCECICIGSTMGWCNNAANPVVEAWTILPQPPKGE